MTAQTIYRKFLKIYLILHTYFRVFLTEFLVTGFPCEIPELDISERNNLVVQNY